MFHEPEINTMASRARRTRMACRLGLLSAVAAAVVGGSVVTATVDASASPTRQCAVHSISVPEGASQVTTTTYLTPGRSVFVAGSGSIWAGVWATEANGPQGWSSIAGAGYPQPSARVYSLLARVNGAWTYVGAGATVTNSGTTTQRIQFRVNDNSPGNGSGAFTASYTTCEMSDKPASQYSVNSLVARHSGKCLDVAYASTAHAANVVQGTCWGGTNQQWTLRPNSAGYYEIVARHSGKCLDVAYASTAHAANVVQGTCWGGTNQHWTIS